MEVFGIILQFVQGELRGRNIFLFYITIFEKKLLTRVKKCGIIQLSKQRRTTKMTVEQIRELKTLEEQIKALQRKADAIKDEIKTEMGNEEHVEVGGFTVNYTIVISTTLDSKKLKKEMPSLWDEYSKEGITRRFSIT